jgi:fatty-acyl-CoA synthase
VVLDEMPMTPVGKIFKPRLRELAAEDAARELLASALPGVAVEIAAGHADRGLMLRAKIPATAAEAARAELGKLPIGFEIAVE